MTKKKNRHRAKAGPDAAVNEKVDKLKDAGRELLESLQQQADGLDQMAEEYLEQGLLGQHCDALQMRERVNKSLTQLRANLGLPVVENPPSPLGADGSSPLLARHESPPTPRTPHASRSPPLADHSEALATTPELPVDFVPTVDGRCAADTAPRAVGVELPPSSLPPAQTSPFTTPGRASDSSMLVVNVPNTSGGSVSDIAPRAAGDELPLSSLSPTQTSPFATRGSAADSATLVGTVPNAASALDTDSCAWCGRAVGPQLTHDTSVENGSWESFPRYRWRTVDDRIVMLDIHGPPEDSGAPIVDVSEVVVHVNWPCAGPPHHSLMLPIGFRADTNACSVARRKRAGGRLEIKLPVLGPLVPPAKSLVQDLSGPHGFGTVDGFTSGEVADRIRSNLLSRWRAGSFTRGKVKGEHAERFAQARSDVFMYIKDGDLVIADFTRHLDRLVLELVREVPALSGLKLMRGSAMATVYTGEGSRYDPHFDSMGDNGRVLTCIMYLNPFWQEGDGAQLALWPEARFLRREGPCHEIAPLHGRLVAFLCCRRNLHEVKPVTRGRYVEPRLAVSCWYYDSEHISQDDECSPADAPTDPN
eukprot:TRINITY_DN74883_c0_g1_i1.p1 TRINITY_DN74883_c0_g1~~TRINITY_DN74883_c0_g1_i1.p1  ORF type:complete len:590 (-),score=83.32 TRINITY_DN74883_c0_g1_i1:47-1816(-)